MNDIVALVVGIETYARKGWEVPGPCCNALKFTKYLIRKGVKPENIFLFTNEKVDEGSQSTIEPKLVALERGGVRRRFPTQQEIDTCFNQLARDSVNNKDRPKDSRLFCYWSGHGYTKGG